MSWKAYLMITVVSLALLSILAGFQSAPGYMDAEYYYSMALRIANNQGMTEPFVWNFLNQVSSIPHPGFSYWMPLPALLSAVGMWVTGIKAFSAAKASHILIAAVIPALTMRIAWKITGSTPESVLAGALAVVPVFYNVFLGTTDSFAVTMLLGGGTVLLLLSEDRPGKYLGLGGMAGLMHLARADGLIWILAGVYCALRAEKGKLLSLVYVGAGYLIFMGPWYARNLITLGRVMPAGISRTFWLTDYNDLFLYSSAGLTFKQWVTQGIPGIMANIARAGAANLKSALLIQGQVILSPFMLLGVWARRRERDMVSVGLVWLAIFVLMTIVFPFAGMRGGYFHSGSSFQPLAWTLSSIGFFQLIEWGVTRRDWNRQKAGTVFGMALVILIVVASVFVFYDRVIGGDFNQPQWDRSFLGAKGIDQYLDDLGITDDEPVMINNPPGLYAASERISVAIPSDDVEAILKAAADFEIRYLVLEENHPGALSEIYLGSESDNRLTYLGQINQAQIFLISENRDVHE